MNFITRLAEASHANRSLLCIGLDLEPSAMPDGIDFYAFNREIIDATRDLVCAYKPNIAFYEADGISGLVALRKTIQYIGGKIPVILDAKRGDIGNTAKAYARAIFDDFGADAVTASPYLGRDSLEPFMERADKGVFILCRTSNAGSGDFQSLTVETATGKKMLFEAVAEKVNEWNVHGNLGLVAGATYPQELKLLRGRYPQMPLLIPGVGSQGGDLQEVMDYGVDVKRERTVINSSRQVLYASKGTDFAEAARKVALKLRDDMNACLEAGK
ncbi:orotidine-5'-phosphate decarboxylase [bacterium]|nr:MAG: orotidine-5'-phosphate decarboxylase [bacterium]